MREQGISDLCKSHRAGSIERAVSMKDTDHTLILTREQVQEMLITLNKAQKDSLRCVIRKSNSDRPLALIAFEAMV